MQWNETVALSIRIKESCWNSWVESNFSVPTHIELSWKIHPSLGPPGSHHNGMVCRHRSVFKAYGIFSTCPCISFFFFFHGCKIIFYSRTKFLLPCSKLTVSFAWNKNLLASCKVKWFPQFYSLFKINVW